MARQASSPEEAPASRILLCEDDANLGNLLKDYLEMEGLLVRLERDGEAGLRAFQTEAFDLCVLDVMMPKTDGFTLAKQIRAQNKTIPIIFLTAKSMKEDKLQGFSVGADDYVAKPFDEEELLARIRAVLRRADPETGEVDTCYPIGRFKFDYENHALLENGDTVRRMTTKESEILRLLYLHKNRILKREDALVAIWGENDYFHGRSFDVFITKLRKYLKPDENVRIDNIHGVGFMLVDEKAKQAT